MYICGIRVDEVTRTEALEKVKQFLESDGQHRLFTPNPEMVVAAQTDALFARILNTSSLNICDGKGIELVGQSVLRRIPGIDFMHDMCLFASKQGYRVFLLGTGDKKNIEDAALELKKLYPTLEIVGRHPGIPLKNIENSPLLIESESHDEMLDYIIQTAPQILFVGFGHSKQEKWIDRYLNDLPSVKVAMGVGGSFDILAGKIKRAPLIFRKFGIEWLWRLLNEPWRLTRIWKATFIFLFFFLFHKYKRT